MIKDRIFRGKTVGPVNVWVTGYYLYSEKQDKHYILGDSVDYGFQQKQVFGDSVGQSTGVYNEQGQLLWEGDIIRNPPGYCGDYAVLETISCINFEDAEFYAYNKADTLWWLYCEVLGNKFDNKELLIEK